MKLNDDDSTTSQSQAEDVELQGHKLVTIDQAYDLMGGFGRFQKISAIFLILTMSFS